MLAIAKPRPLSKKAWERREEAVRAALVQLQVQLKAAPFKILLIVAGHEGSGCGQLINTLTSWLDPRGLETFSFREETDEEKARPFLWRFWRSLPTIGRIGIYAGSWYTETLREETHGRKARRHLRHELERIRQFERMLADNGTLVLKLWIDLSKDDQREHLQALEADPDTAWRVTPQHWRAHRRYDRLEALAKEILTATDQPGARWHRLDAPNPRTRDAWVAAWLLRQFAAHQKKAARLPAPVRPAGPLTPVRPAGPDPLAAIELQHELPEDVYEEKREKWLGRLHRAVRAAQEAERAVVFVFEGWDAAGKGGAIRRLVSAIDARDYRVIPVAKPTEEEKSHHYLWRFWRHIPPRGLVTVFDRSWYGRVLVERVEGFCREDEWQRAYRELKQFEAQLCEFGVIVIKFWLQVSKEEQLRRFRERERVPYKRHKINEEDWRNRKQWEAYEVAVSDMLALTDTGYAPWHIIPANNKRFARLQVLKHACRQIEEALEGR